MERVSPEQDLKAQLARYIARAGYDIEVHPRKTPRLEQHPKPRPPTSTVIRYNYYGLPERDAPE
jgi:hypothetical protein